MIKLKSLLKEEMVSLGGMKIPLQLTNLYFTLEMCPKHNIYVHAQDQTRLYKALERFGEKATIEPILNKINNRYGETGFYTLASANIDATKPIMFKFVPNDQA